jgi:hypothetical protein
VPSGSQRSELNVTSAFGSSSAHCYLLAAAAASSSSSSSSHLSCYQRFAMTRSCSADSLAYVRCWCLWLENAAVLSFALLCFALLCVAFPFLTGVLLIVIMPPRAPHILHMS